MSSRKWNTGRNRLPKLVQTIAPPIPFPGRHFISPVCRECSPNGLFSSEPSDLQQLDEPSVLDDLDLLDRGDDEMKEDEDEADDAFEEEKMRDDSDEPVDVDGDAEDDDLMDYGF